MWKQAIIALFVNPFYLLFPLRSIMDDEELRRRRNEMKNKQYSQSTTKTYESKIRQLKRWLREKKPQLMMDDGEIRITNHDDDAILLPSDFQDFLLSQETSSLRSGEKMLVSHSCLSGHRSALKYYYKKRNVKFDDDVWRDELNSVLISLWGGWLLVCLWNGQTLLCYLRISSSTTILLYKKQILMLRCRKTSPLCTSLLICVPS